MAEVTNYIDRLVAELCPDGVDFYTIDELITLDFGTRITKSKDAGTIYPVYGGGGASFRTDNYNREDKYVVSRFAMSEKCVRYVSGKFWMLDSGFTYSVKDESLLSYKYISYWLLNSQQEIYACSSQSAQRNLKTAEFKRFEVPVPPLEIQEAIVEILDKFTNLEAELEAELEARTLQHEYYRDSLFEALDCPRVPLGSFTQYSKDRKRDDSTVSVYVGVENLKSDFQGCAPTESTNPGVVFQKGDILLGNIRPYLKKMWRADSDGVASPDVLVIRIRDEFSEKISSRYLYHLLASNEFVGYNVAHSRGGKMPRGNKAKILEFEAPIPSLEEQQRIVDILDRFDALTASLSEGLPAELAARRSQYEYYRDQLLTFPRKGENQ